MPLLASGCVLALCVTSAVGETLPRDFGRAGPSFAARDVAPATGAKLPAGVLRTTLPSPYGVASLSMAASETAGTPQIARLDTAWTSAIPGLRLGDSVADAGTPWQPVRFGGLHYGTGSVAPGSPAIGSGPVAAAPYALPGTAAPGGIPVPSPAATLLRPGLADRALAVGFLRSNYGLPGDRYGPPFASTALRRGISQEVTAELHGGLQRGTSNGGIALLLRPKDLGTFSVGTAASQSDAGTGALTQAGYEYRRAGFSTSVRSQWSSAEFRRLGTDAETIAPRYSTVATTTYDAARRGAVSLAYGTVANYNEALVKTVQGTCRLAVGRTSTLTLSASQALSPEPATTLMLTLAFPLDQTARPSAAKAGAPQRMWTFEREPALLDPAGLLSGGR